jgi:hypothetical protein
MLTTAAHQLRVTLRRRWCFGPNRSLLSSRIWCNSPLQQGQVLSPVSTTISTTISIRGGGSRRFFKLRDLGMGRKPDITLGLGVKAATIQG